MLRLSHFWCAIATAAPWLNQLYCVNQFSTAIALVAFRIIIVAHRTLTSDESIGKESVTFKTKLLINNFLKCVALSMQMIENILCDFGLLLSSSPTKMVEVTIKPIVDFSVKLIIMITNLLASLTFFHSFCFSGSSVLISATNVNRVMTYQTAITRKYVCW